MSVFRYEGKWKIPNIDELQEGVLFIDQDNGIIRLRLFVIKEEGWGLASNVRTVCDIIYGNLMGNNKVTLVDCTVIKRHEHIGSYTEVFFDARWALWGNIFDSKDKICHKHYSVYVDGILNWTRLCEYKSLNVGSYEWVSRDKKEITMDNGLVLQFIPMCKSIQGIIPREKELCLQQYIEIDFEYESDTSLSDFFDDLNKLEMLITIGSRSVPFVNKINYYDERNVLPIGNGNFIKPQEIYLGEKKYSSGYESNVIEMLFDLNDISDNQQKSMNKWLSISYKISPTVNLYFSIYKYSDMPVEMRYLNIVQALETYHARFKYNKLKEYKKHVLDLFKCENIDDIDEKNRQGYFDTTQSDPNITYIILKSRLVDLFNDDFRFNLNPLFSDGEEIDNYSFIEKVVDTRHYYTHYGKEKENKSFKGLDMEYAIAVLMEVFEYHFLKELGLNAAGKINRKHTNLTYWYTERCTKCIDVNN